MRFYSCEELDNTGLVKTLYVPKDVARFRVFSHDEKREDFKNYKEVAHDFGITEDRIVRYLQGHTDNIRVVTDIEAGEGVVRAEPVEFYDGVITNKKNLLICTIEADCTPVFILDPINKAIGMVHSGWRGTVKKISIKALELMNKHYGTKVSDVLVYFGPSICGKCYEVGSDLIPEFKKILDDKDIDDIFKPIKGKDEKYFLDVTEGIRKTLIMEGVNEKNIIKSKYCTYHDNIFASWRRDRDKSKQMLTGIMLI